MSLIGKTVTIVDNTKCDISKIKEAGSNRFSEVVKKKKLPLMKCLVIDKIIAGSNGGLFAGTVTMDSYLLKDVATNTAYIKLATSIIEILD